MDSDESSPSLLSAWILIYHNIYVARNLNTFLLSLCENQIKPSYKFNSLHTFKFIRTAPCAMYAKERVLILFGKQFREWKYPRIPKSEASRASPWKLLAGTIFCPISIIILLYKVFSVQLEKCVSTILIWNHCKRHNLVLSSYGSFNFKSESNENNNYFLQISS